MAKLTVKGNEYELKCSIFLDKALNKLIKVEDKDGKLTEDKKLSGGISKVLPQLIEEDAEALVQIWSEFIKLKGDKVKEDDILAAIDEAMEDAEDATEVFKDVLDAINESNFSRNELKKFAKNMKLVKIMKQKDEDEKAKAEMMVQRLADGYEAITGRKLFEEKATA